MKKNICGDVKMAHIATQCRCCKNIIQIPCSDETYIAAQFWNAATDPRPIQTETDTLHLIKFRSSI